MSSNDDAAREQAANYKRDLDRACRYEPPPPTAEPRRPTSTGPSVADLERTLGIGQPANPAPRRRTETFYK